MDQKIHPATTVSNIKNLIPITLEVETSQYSTWIELFRTICRAYQVIQHLSPKPSTKPSSSTDADKDKADADKDKAHATPVDDQWDRLDAIVLQWIYSSISNDLPNTIVTPGMTAYDAWTTLEGLFHDNKTARALQLIHKFSNTRSDGFPSMSAYCQALKYLADQLTNVGAPVDNKRLVLQLLGGLIEPYQSISTILQQKDPTPSFYEARSQLIMIEGQKVEKALYASQMAAQALTSSTTKTP
ncbi:uncharacterized protein LOC110907098 [Helianthus annuus]|uniref:uncharacterized protein LOC110907098 n=1 Tax=Helianthus annuus TaxID=4232 RepID=UPI000B8F4274|nr:uncharacterized protein LOC110907098 [Helianthus annuus]